MAEFNERSKINTYLHPFSQPPAGGGMSGDGFELGPAWQGDQGAPLGSPSRYLKNVSDATRSKDYDPNQSVGTLDNDRERYEALNQLNMQQAGDLESEHRCGAYVLLGGATIADGGAGISTLIDSVEAFRKKNGGTLDGKKLKDETDALATLKEKMAKHEKLTAGEMNAIASDVYDMMGSKSPNGIDGGTNRDRVEQLMQESPELRKMFKDHDLSYDAVDPTGAHRGGHAVLGIGHGKSDKDHTGPHQAVYDPYRRTSKSVEAQQAVRDASEKLEQDKEGSSWERFETMRAHGDVPAWNQFAANRAEEDEKALAKAQQAELDSHHDLGQVITDKKTLAIYQGATDTTLEMNDSVKGGVKERNFEHGPFDGMYD